MKEETGLMYIVKHQLMRFQQLHIPEFQSTIMKI